MAELLFGQASPSGKLPVTFYRNEDLAALPDFTDYSMAGRTYRYFHGTPLYPFGFGLSYGDCRLTALSADGNKATVTVKNCGGRAAEEVIQLYVKDGNSPLAPDNPLLCGFRRVALAAGEEKSFDLAIDERAFTVVDEAGRRLPGSGSWTLYAGLGGPDERTRELTGREALSITISG